MLRKLIFLIFGLFICNEFLLGQEVVHVERGFTSEKITDKQVVFLEDQQGALSIQEITKPEYQNRFQNITKDDPNFGISNHVYWLKIKVQKEPRNPLNTYLLEVAYPLLDSVQIFHRDGQGVWQTEIFGDALPFSSRDIKHRNFIFSVPLIESRVKTIYLRIHSKGSIIAPLVLYRPDAMREVQVKEDTLYGIFYGAMVVMGLYNLFIFFVVRDKNYLIYTLVIILNLLFQANFSGHTIQYFWGDHPSWSNVAVLFFTHLLFMVNLIFCISFLQVKSYQKFLYYAAIAFILFNLISAFFPFWFDYNAIVRFTLPIVSISTLIIISSGVWTWTKGSQYARLFVVAWIFYVTGGILQQLKHYGVLSSSFWTDNSTTLGSLLEVVFLSFALADKIVFYRRSAEKSQRELLKKTQENAQLVEEQNERLASEVKKQTKELQTTNEELQTANEEIQAVNETLSVTLSTVKRQNEEISEKNNRIQSAYQNIEQINRIAKVITSILSIESLSKAIYLEVNELMEAEILGIGVYEQETNSIYFPSIYVNGKAFSEQRDSLTEKRLSTIAYQENSTILFDDYVVEAKKKYAQILFPDKEENLPSSVMYVPINYKEKRLGVLTVQSFRKEAYSSFHVSLMENLAIYVAISLENIKTLKKVENLSVVAQKTNSQVLILNQRADVEWGNMAFLQSYRCSSIDEFHQKWGRNFYEINRSDKVINQIKHVIASKENSSFVIKDVLRDPNRAYWFQVNLTPILNEKGEVERLVGIGNDISELRDVQEELKRNHKLLSKKNQQIMDSINYASRIQKAILPLQSTFDTLLPDHFILFKPRDIVSGDFYYIREVNHKMILAAVDCTGHGVPGAFMSFIGYLSLNILTVIMKITSVSEILKEMHEGIRRVLRQRETNANDGMDMTVVSIDKENKLMKFAGAKNPLVYIQNNELKVIKGDRVSIGGKQKEAERTFTAHQIDISQPTTFYLFSDGYQDQFGGPEGRKFMTKRFRNLLLEIHQKPMEEQKEVLDQTIQDWMKEGNEEQVDDILVVGVKV